MFTHNLCMTSLKVSNSRQQGRSLEKHLLADMLGHLSVIQFVILSLSVPRIIGHLARLTASPVTHRAGQIAYQVVFLGRIVGQHAALHVRRRETAYPKLVILVGPKRGGKLKCSEHT